MKEKKQIINEHVNGLIRHYLENLARQEGKRDRETVSDLTHILNHSNAKIGEKTWSREDLHER